MKRNDLIELLKTLPEDAEIVITEGDDTLGDYSFNTHLTLSETEGYQSTTRKGTPGAIYTSYSNYADFSNPIVKVWTLN